VAVRIVCASCEDLPAVGDPHDQTLPFAPEPAGVASWPCPHCAVENQYAAPADEFLHAELQLCCDYCSTISTVLVTVAATGTPPPA
jgi:hypothetical protein